MRVRSLLVFVMTLLASCASQRTATVSPQPVNCLDAAAQPASDWSVAELAVTVTFRRKPVKDATVSVLNLCGAGMRTLITDESGTARFRRIAAGDVEIDAFAVRKAKWARPEEMLTSDKHRLHLKPADTQSIGIELEHRAQAHDVITENLQPINRSPNYALHRTRSRSVLRRESVTIRRAAPRR
jgi:hypothetical protein